MPYNPGMKLTAAQRSALADIVNAWDTANEHQIARWGAPLRGGVTLIAGRSTLNHSLTFDIRTIRALEDAGLIAVERYDVHSESLRRGSYGRWIGGSTRRVQTGMNAKPTAAGRRALEAVR